MRDKQSLRLWSCGVALALCLFAHAETVVVGPTFEIAEPDTLEEIRTRVAQQDWDKIMKKKEPADYGAFKAAPLPAALKSDSHLFDPTYVLPYDLRDADGKLLAAKGTRINVYEKITLPGRYIVIDGSEKQLRWLEEVAKPVDGDRILIATGNVYSARLRSKYSLWLLDQRGIERFGLRAVPSIVQQEGLQLRVNEYAL